ncbi:hypothetical protein [Mycobacteroides abscessus]|uniref:hypothetical protein n=1 Tax=Mycobacteroides abscessus TaxID=36809 RepID=UPI0012FFD34D|nr:hypothetical protein [Mycobacteroides abscessus]
MALDEMPVKILKPVSSLHVFKRLEAFLRHRQRAMTERFLRQESIDIEKFCHTISTRLQERGLNYLQCIQLIVSEYENHTLREQISSESQPKRRFRHIRKIADNLVGNRISPSAITVDDAVLALLSVIGGKRLCDDIAFLWKCGKLLEKWEKIDSVSAVEYATRKGRRGGL